MKRRMVRVAGVAAIALLALAVLEQPDGVEGQPPGGRQGPPDGPFGPPRFPLLTALDADGDGEVSAGEIDGAGAALKKLDKNSDGKLDRDELRPQFGRQPGRPRPDRPGTDGPARFEAAPLAGDDAEKKILSVLKDMDQNRRRGAMNVPEEDGRLLRLLAEAAGAKKVVEIGTSNGCSAIWFCLALRKTGGKLITHEIDARRAALARENFKRAGVADLVTLVEGDAHEQIARLDGPIDVLFLDADKEGYVDYLETLLPKMRPGGLVVAHNMNTRQADPRYLKAITTNPGLETLFLHMQGAGVGVTLRKR